VEVVPPCCSCYTVEEIVNAKLNDGFVLAFYSADLLHETRLHDQTTSKWSIWSPCSVSCGRGTQSRVNKEGVKEKKQCFLQYCPSKVLKSNFFRDFLLLPGGSNDSLSNT